MFSFSNFWKSSSCFLQKPGNVEAVFIPIGFIETIKFGAKTSTTGWSTCPLSAIFFKELLFLAYDKKVAYISGMPVSFLDHFFLTLLALSVVISVKVVGIILVSALLVIPGAAAFQITSRYFSMLMVSIAVALTSTIGGLIISYYADLASGATIVTLASCIFFVIFIIARLRE